MSKRNMDGDVLANKLSLVSAKGQKLLASMLGPQPDAQPSHDAPNEEEKDNDLDRNFSGHDRLGVGSIPPKDIADGTFTRRTMTSDDKLLQQLSGKKKAKAHLAAKQEAERRGAASQPKPSRKEVAKQEESEDEEEGRAAAFESKRRKIARPKAGLVSEEDGGSEREATSVPPDEEEEQKSAKEIVPERKFYDDVEPAVTAPKAKPLPSRSRAKPTSYLDELLASRSQKKKNKAKGKGVQEA